MKKAFMLLLVLLLVGSTAVFASGQAEGGEAESMTLRYGELNPDGHPITEGAYEFARLVEEKTDGRITIEVFPSSQLGSEREQMQAIQQGGLDFFRPNTAAMPDFNVPEMAILGLPYVFSSREHMWDALNGDVGEQILSAVQERGSRMVGLAYLDDGARHFFTTDTPVYEVSDLEGLKIRVPENEVFVDMVAAMGGSPTPISYSELYSSLQTGVVDGAENTIAGYLTNSFYEPAPYFTLDRHMSPPGLIVASEQLWNELSEADREIILESAREASDFVREETVAFEEDALDELEDEGVEIIQIEDSSEWQEAVRPLWEQYGSGFEDLLDEIAALQ
jgi:tripartite ATP-independent transporter DctP family solute receptor